SKRLAATFEMRRQEDFESGLKIEAAAIERSGTQREFYSRITVPRMDQSPNSACRFTNAAGAVIFQAATRAGQSVARVADRSFTFVAPRSPQPPVTGANTFGCASTNCRCRVGVNLTIPHDASGYHNEAKTRFPTRKSG